jgi:1-acyl-sn-glycerol-3-phosphate acyltransferase
LTTNVLGETALRRWSRRAVSIPSYVLAWAVALALAPVGGLLAAISGWTPARLALYAAVFLSYELAGLAASVGLWAAGRARDRDAHAALQRWWAGSLFRWAQRIFALELRVEGDGEVEPGPLVILIRHASLADTLLPEVVLASRHGLRLRYVLKRELLFDPCLDVVGQRLHCAFISRGSGESEREIAAIAALAEGLGPREGALIYPEGTRFSEAKRRRALERIAAAGQTERLARVRALRHVLPPRSAGPLALVASGAPADVLFVAHTGLEGLASVRDLLSGSLVGRTIRVALHRTPRSVIPEERTAALRWLDDEWARVDAWIENAHREDGR